MLVYFEFFMIKRQYSAFAQFLKANASADTSEFVYGFVIPNMAKQIISSYCSREGVP